MKSSDAIKELEAVGFTVKRRGKGSHLILQKDWERIVISHPTELSSGMTRKVRTLVRRHKT